MLNISTFAKRWMWIVNHLLRFAWSFPLGLISLEHSPEGISCPELTPPEPCHLHFSLSLLPNLIYFPNLIYLFELLCFWNLPPKSRRPNITLPLCSLSEVLPNICWQRVSNICWQGLSNICWQSLPNVCWQGLPNICWQGLQINLIQSKTFSDGSSWVLAHSG